MTEHRRLAFALLISLLIHALLLSLTFGDEEFGFPGLGFPWENRRIEAPRLNIVLAPPPQSTLAEPSTSAVTEPLPQAPAEQAAASRPVPTPSMSPPSSGLTIVASARPLVNSGPSQNAAAEADSSQAPPRTKRPIDAPPTQTSQPSSTDLVPSDKMELPALPAPSAPMPDVNAAQSVSSTEPGAPTPRDPGNAVQERIVIKAPEPTVEQAAARQEAERREAARLAAVEVEAQRQTTARLEATRVEASQQEAERQEAARLATAEVEAQRQAAARQEAVRTEASRQEAERREAARLAAAELEAQRQSAARQEAARNEASRQEAERREAARLAATELEAQQQTAARQEAARAEAARQEAERREAARLAAAAVEARREEKLRAIGRQLDAEAAQREAASTKDQPPNLLPFSLSTARRIRLLGRAHANAELIQYAEAWARKIQSNTTVETVREVAKRPHKNALVSVAIRSDGSVESVTFVTSSGVAEVDDAIRKIVKAQKPYAEFPPALAREYDVVEIRRTWTFNTVVRLQ